MYVNGLTKYNFWERYSTNDGWTCIHSSDWMTREKAVKWINNHYDTFLGLVDEPTCDCECCSGGWTVGGDWKSYEVTFVAVGGYPKGYDIA